MHMPRVLALAALALCFCACDSGDGGERIVGPPDPTFEGTVSGDVNVRLAGHAFAYGYSRVVDPNEPGETLPAFFTLSLISPGADGWQSVDVRLAGEPAVGSYELGGRTDALGAPTATLALWTDAEVLLAQSVAGTLTISRVDAEVVAGTLSFSTEEALEGDGLGEGIPGSVPDPGGLDFRPFEAAIEAEFVAARRVLGPDGTLPYGPRPYDYVEIAWP